MLGEQPQTLAIAAVGLPRRQLPQKTPANSRNGKTRTYAYQKRDYKRSATIRLSLLRLHLQLNFLLALMISSI
jgi:hypothetical protein